jgi:SAM-dependent methyltransferase
MQPGSGVECWNQFWAGKDPITQGYLSQRLWDASRSCVTQLIYEHLKQGSPDSKRLLEIGSGLGTTALLFAILGFKTVVSDASDASLQRARECFDMLGIRHCEFRLWNILEETPFSFRNSFDITVSVGLGEHFSGGARERVFVSHYQPLKPGGVAILTVPGAASWPYRVVKRFRELTGTWDVGLEIPYTEAEIQDCCRRQNLPSPRIYAPRSVVEDVREYGLGLLYACKILFPASIQNLLRRMRKTVSLHEGTRAVALELLSTPEGRNALLLNSQKSFGHDRHFPTSSVLIVTLTKPAD